MARIASAKPGDVIAFGHAHPPWQRTLDGVLLVNTGSVGRPKDGDWRAGYTLLDVGDGEARAAHLRLEYDLAEAARAIRESDLPDDFAEYLRTGGRPAATTLQQ
jgi:diadenosine tetraphosphatase ApaH/serine/threonine PP2A family protein phosphatase